MEFTIVQSQPSKPPRAYRKIKDSDAYKDFVLQKHNIGMRQKAIREALKKEKGVDIEPWKLKRILEKWGASNKSLTKKRKLYIHRTISERRRANKRDPRVKLGRSNRVLSAEEIKDIMSLQPEQFKNLKPSPGDIEFFTPTPAADIIEDEISVTSDPPSREDSDMYGCISQVRSLEYDTDGMEVDSDTDGMEVDSDADEMEVDSDIDLHSEGTTDCDEGNPFSPSEAGYEPAETEINNSGDTIEDIQKAIVAITKTLGFEDDEETDLVDENALEYISDVAETQDELLVDEAPDVEENDWSIPLLRRYARTYEKDYRDSVKSWKNDAKSRVQRLDVRLAQGMSHEMAAREASAWCEERAAFFIPYEVCMNILNTGIGLEGRDGERDDGNSGKAILSYVDRLFLNLTTEGSSDYLPELLAGKPTIVHLPRFIREHGFQSFFTAWCLQVTFCALARFQFRVSGDSLLPLVENSLQIFYAIGFNCEPFIWNMSYFGLTKCRQRDILLRKLQQHYGPYHTFMLEIDASRLLWMLRRKGSPNDPAQRKTIQTLQLRIFRGLGRRDLGFGGCSGSFFYVLSLLLKYLCAADAGIFAKALKDCISKKTFRQGSQARAWNRAVAGCTLTLGIACSQIGELAFSLEMLIRAYTMFGKCSMPDITGLALRKIYDVADARGPILYRSLYPVLVDAQKRFATAGIKYIGLRSEWQRVVAKNKAYRTFCLGKEYSNILAIQSSNRPLTPDLQQYLHYQGLESWMWSEGLYDLPDSTDLGGRAMECSETELGTEMQVDTMSVEEELRAITQRYRQAEAAGLIDANDRY
ncbi:hypothetical protein TWF730_001601 [Orbilia blumenaviensis]|uniref:Clr5 domain-containing protein n=1 Tax=Orbilia blumenaviensis TaxID=1796055 RepID=A0AAV9UPC4_9PEZI